MKILFIGTVEFSYKALEKLISMNANVVGVCTKEKSSFNSDFVDLSPLCIKNNIAYKFVDDINSSANIEWIKSLKPDVVFCFGWSSLIKKEVLSISHLGVIGYHPTKLPQNRGRHPIIWALALGLKSSASTFFFMDEGADSGDILSQEEFEIGYSDNAHTVYQKMIAIALLQIEQFVPMLQNKTYSRIKQDNSTSNVWRKRGIIDGKIDFRMSSLAIYNLVRALTKPYVGAHIEFNNKLIAIWRVEEIVCNANNIEPGKILNINNNTIDVKTYDGAIRILEHSFIDLPQIGSYL